MIEHTPPAKEFDPQTPIEIDEHVCLLTVDEYLSMVEAGGFIDDDGFGHPASGRSVGGTMTYSEDTSFAIYPSLGREAIPHGATHINWFNK